MASKVLHIGKCDKFIPPFIEFVNLNFSPKEHEFLLKSGMAENELDDSNNVHLAGKTTTSNFIYYLKMFVKMHSADKVILHSLFDIKVVQILFFSPWLLKKCYWVIWGGDLYSYQFGIKSWKWKVKEFLRKRVISNLGHLITYLKGDVDLARKWYSAKGEYHECFMYISNLYKDYEITTKESSCVNILVGNSAALSNNHIAALKKLLAFKNDNIRIYVPLSYGPQEYAQQVIKQGKEWFGDKFQPLTNFMPFDEYLSFLGGINIAIFNHKRQQAMGNTITLLGLGKTVYIRSDTAQWQFFEEKGIKIGDVEQFNTLEVQNLIENISRVKTYFSQSNYLKQLENLFN